MSDIPAWFGFAVLVIICGLVGNWLGRQERRAWGARLIARTRPFDIADYLTSEDVITGYLEEAENSGDEKVKEIAHAAVKRARERMGKQ